MIKRMITPLYSLLQEDGSLLPKTSLIAFITGLSLLVMGGACSLLFIFFNKASFLNIHLLETSKNIIQIILQSGSVIFFSVFLTLFIIGFYRNMRITKNKELQSISSDENLIKVALNQEITLGMKFTTLTLALFSFFAGLFPLVESSLQLTKDIAAAYIVAPSLFMIVSATMCATAFLLVFAFYFVTYTNKSISNLVKSHRVRITFYTANKSLKNKFDTLPETERVKSLEKAKSLGISPSNKSFMKTVLTEYEKRHQTAMNEEKQLNTKTASAPNSNRKQTRL